jgi:hypothetical protein
MKLMLSVCASLAVVALLNAAPVGAEMAAVSDSDLDTISGKGNASVTFGGYEWSDNHAADASDHKGALDNQGTINLTGINTANVWGVYAGAEAISDGNTGNTEAEATANLAIGGF